MQIYFGRNPLNAFINPLFIPEIIVTRNLGAHTQPSTNQMQSLESELYRCCDSLRVVLSRKYDCVIIFCVCLNTVLLFCVMFCMHLHALRFRRHRTNHKSTVMSEVGCDTNWQKTPSVRSFYQNIFKINRKVLNFRIIRVTTFRITNKVGPRPNLSVMRKVVMRMMRKSG